MSLKSLKIAGFKEFFKRLYAEHKLHKTLKSLAPRLSLLQHKLKRIESEQRESFNEIASINSDMLVDNSNLSVSKPNKGLKSPLSTIVEQSDVNASDNEEIKTLDSLLSEVFSIVDALIPNENKIINQYKLELKNLAMEIQDLEEQEENSNKEPNNLSEKEAKSQENIEFFKKLYEKENQKLTKLSKRFEILQGNFDKMQDFINILQTEKEKLLKELEKEKKLSYKLQTKKDQENLDKFKEREKNLPISESFDKKILEKDSLITDLQKQVKMLQNNLTKARSDLALASESRNSSENEAKMLKNIKELLEKENEKLSKQLEKKEKYIKELLFKVENPQAQNQKLAVLEEHVETLHQELREANSRTEQFKTQTLELQFINKSLFKKEEILDLRHKIDQLEYRLMMKDEELESTRFSSVEKTNNLQYQLEADRKRIRELEESMLRLMKENKGKEEEIGELKGIIENYSDIGRDLKGIKKKLFN